MKYIIGVSIFWMGADFVASFLSPIGAAIVGLIILAVVLTTVGYLGLSALLDREVNPLAGLMLSLPGWLLTEFVFHWHLKNPAATYGPAASGQAGAGFVSIMGVTLFDFVIVGAGMAIVALPALPLILKLRDKN